MKACITCLQHCLDKLRLARLREWEAMHARSCEELSSLVALWEQLAVELGGVPGELEVEYDSSNSAYDSSNVKYQTADLMLHLYEAENAEQAVQRVRRLNLYIESLRPRPGDEPAGEFWGGIDREDIAYIAVLGADRQLDAARGTETSSHASEHVRDCVDIQHKYFQDAEKYAGNAVG